MNGMEEKQLTMNVGLSTKGQSTCCCQTYKANLTIGMEDNQLFNDRQFTFFNTFVKKRAKGKKKKCMSRNDTDSKPFSHKQTNKQTCKKQINKQTKNHCNALLSGVPASSIQRLQRTQNSVVRLVLKKKKTDHINILLCSLHWLPVLQRILYKIGTLCYKCIHRFAPSYPCD